MKKSRAHTSKSGLKNQSTCQVLNSNLVGTPCNHGDDGQTERNPITVLTVHREGKFIKNLWSLTIREKKDPILLLLSIATYQIRDVA